MKAPFLQGLSKMDLVSKALFFGFQCCPACGSYSVRESLLCGFCEDALLEKASPLSETLGAWTVRSLYRWNPGESDRLSALLVALKGSSQPQAWKFWARCFSRHHSSFLPAGRIHSLAVPRRKGSKRPDHAHHWTAALSEQYGLSFQGAPFAKEFSESQRRKSGVDRDRGPSLVKITELSTDPTGLWVLGDDIVTTGMTARSVHRALGRPLPFEVWCLARRGPL